MGSGGLVAESFAQLLEQLWKEPVHSVNPVNFKHTFECFDEQFKGVDQHDSQEFFVGSRRGESRLGEAGGRAARGLEQDQEEAVHRDARVQDVREGPGQRDVGHLPEAEHQHYRGPSVWHDLQPHSLHGV